MSHTAWQAGRPGRLVGHIENVELDGGCKILTKYVAAQHNTTGRDVLPVSSYAAGWVENKDG